MIRRVRQRHRIPCTILSVLIPCPSSQPPTSVPLSPQLLPFLTLVHWSLRFFEFGPWTIKFIVMDLSIIEIITTKSRHFILKLLHFTIYMIYIKNINFWKVYFNIFYAKINGVSKLFKFNFFLKVRGICFDFLTALVWFFVWGNFFVKFFSYCFLSFIKNINFWKVYLQYFLYKKSIVFLNYSFFRIIFIFNAIFYQKIKNNYNYFFKKNIKIIYSSKIGHFSFD